MEFGASVFINGHDHYERFALEDPNGVADREYGIRQFVVGMGGAGSIRLLQETTICSE